MSGTKSPQKNQNCPNCSAKGYVEDTNKNYPDDPVALIDCTNDNCSVDRFWGIPDQIFNSN